MSYWPHARHWDRTTPARCSLLQPARAVGPAHAQLRDGMARPGMGESSMAASLASVGVQSAGGIMAGVATSAGSIWGVGASVAVPVIGAVVAGVTLALMAIFNRKGPKQKVATTEIVDKVEPLLQQNLAGYMSGPRTQSSQAQAIENFKAGWQYVVDNCNVPVMGNPGKECVSDRQRGGEWDWAAYYLDPIANDPEVKHDSTALVGGGGGGVTEPMQGSVAGVPTPLLLAGLGIVLAMTMGGTGGRR